MEPDPSPLKAVVIISSADNPSLGKTITVVGDDGSVSTAHFPTRSVLSSPTSPLPLTHPVPNSIFTFKSLLFHPRKLLGLVGISLLACLICASFVNTTFQNLKTPNEDEKKDPVSFVHPLYYKHRFNQAPREDVDRILRDSKLQQKSVIAIHDNSDSFEIQTDGSTNFSLLTVQKSGSSSLLPVQGNVYPDGFYYTYVLVGNPPSPYYLDIDTGSELTWVQCDAPCTSCAKGANELYKPRKGNLVPSKDSFCQEVQRKVGKHCEACHQCDYEIEYADHSSSMGVLARDHLHLLASNGSLINSNFIFGCAYDQQGSLLTSLAKTDGILGLSGGETSLPSQLASLGIIKNVVGHCLSKDSDSSGYMFLGDNLLPRWGMVWAPMSSSSSLKIYETQIGILKYGNNPLRLGSQNGGLGTVTFDTGSSYTYFTNEAFVDLISSVKEVSGAGLTRDTSDSSLPYCWRAGSPIRSVGEVKQFFKTISLQYSGSWRLIPIKFRIPPEGYLVISKKGNVCLGILNGSNVNSGSTIIIGDISLHGQLIAYDNENKRIGWMASDCAKPSSVQGLPFFDV